MARLPKLPINYIKFRHFPHQQQSDLKGMKIAFCRSPTILLAGPKITNMQTENVMCIFTKPEKISIMKTSDQKEIFEMATFSTKQEKKQGMSNQMSVLLAVAIIGAFVIFGPLNATLYNSINSVLASFDSPDGVSVNTDASFASDQNYWSDNCSHGWDSDATCDAIVSRVQSCEVGLASDYCTSNESYIQQYYKK